MLLPAGNVPRGKIKGGRVKLGHVSSPEEIQAGSDDLSRAPAITDDVVLRWNLRVMSGFVAKLRDLIRDGMS